MQEYVGEAELKKRKIHGKFWLFLVELLVDLQYLSISTSAWPGVSPPVRREPSDDSPPFTNHRDLVFRCALALLRSRLKGKAGLSTENSDLNSTVVTCADNYGMGKV